MPSLKYTPQQGLPYEFNIRKVVYKPSHEALEQTAYWVNKTKEEINKRLKDLMKYDMAD